MYCTVGCRVVITICYYKVINPEITKKIVLFLMNKFLRSVLRQIYTKFNSKTFKNETIQKAYAIGCW